jgi:hypothetical protein
MIVKIFKAFWFLSLLATLGSLLFTYAGLPEEIVVQEVDARSIYISKEVFFYAALAVMALTNVLVYIMARMFPKEEGFRSWFYGLIITLNAFFVVAFSMISLYNSNEKFDYNRIAFVIYGSVVLIAAWAVSWPVYSVFRKIYSKQAV